MKHILYIVFLAILLSSCSIKQVSTTQRTISVTGSGTMLVNPDIATLSLEVITRDNDIQKASEDNANRMSAVQSALEDLGIKSQDIRTYDFDLQQERSYSNGRTLYGQYIVTNKIGVSIKDIESVGNVIDVAIKNGATSMNGLEFSFSKQQEASKEARIMAMQNAAETASLMASTLGVEVGKVISIAEHTGGANYPMALNASKEYFSGAEDRARSTPVSFGKKEITVCVDVVYSLVK